MLQASGLRNDTVGGVFRFPALITISFPALVLVWNKNTHPGGCFRIWGNWWSRGCLRILIIDGHDPSSLAGSWRPPPTLSFFTPPPPTPFFLRRRSVIVSCHRAVILYASSRDPASIFYPFLRTKRSQKLILLTSSLDDGSQSRKADYSALAHKT
jgi:hypothetical protein